MVQRQEQEHLLSKISRLSCLIFYRFTVCAQAIGASPCPGSASSLRAGRKDSPNFFRQTKAEGNSAVQVRSSG